MRVQVQSLWLPKKGSEPDEYEDSYDFSYNQREPRGPGTSPPFLAVDRQMSRPRFAVADGATESSFSGLWAQLLVHEYVFRDPRTASALRKLTQECSLHWVREANARPLPWYAAEKVQRGSHAALVGLSLRSGRNQNCQGGSWTALAVGDSCLFQVRGDTVITRFPVKRADDMGYHPLLLSTIGDKNEAVWAEPDRLKQAGEWLAGDAFLLMTDALAQWFLEQDEDGEKPWDTLGELVQPLQPHLPAPFTDERPPGESLKSPVSDSGLVAARFRKWIEEKRDTRAIRNDDVTLLIVTIGEQSHETAAIH